jgi:hypothetical protein
MSTSGRYVVAGNSWFRWHAACLRGSVALLLSIATLALGQNREISVPAAGETLRVRLLAPLTTNFSRKGDMVSARVLEPASFEGGILEGEIRDLKVRGPGQESSIQFEFHTLHMADKAVPVTAVVMEIANSKRQAGMDEDGTALENGGRSAPGKLAAGILSHGVGPTRLTVKFNAVTFAPGSELVLLVQPRKAR